LTIYPQQTWSVKIVPFYRNVGVDVATGLLAPAVPTL